MHVRLSSCLGISIVAEDTEEAIGTVTGILLDPDRATVEGFFVRIPGIFSQSSSLFLSSFDVAHFGRRILVCDHDRVAPAEDFLRVQPLLSDPRTILGQRIRTESGIALGRCRDVQFDTSTMRLMWVFPKRMFRWGRPVCVRDILEVRPEAIIVRDPPAVMKELVREDADRTSLLPLLPETSNRA